MGARLAISLMVILMTLPLPRRMNLWGARSLPGL
jgi:hypothetical protein